MTADATKNISMMKTSTTKYNFILKRNNFDPSSVATMSIDELFPALLECFGIMLCGYIAGRTNIITSTQAKGLGSFISMFALPALLFKSMVLLNFANVIWPFLWSILIAKVFVFCLVLILTLIVARPDSRFSKAGLFSIFATQSNDFALGYPIVKALYQSTYPEYLQYIYLVAPVSLILLNPIGFILCEIQKWKNEENTHQSKLRLVGLVLWQVLKNPIVFMVCIGVIAHFVLHQRIPAILAEFVDGLANSFGGVALFYLGLTMVGQLRKFTRSTVGTLILLTTAKLLLMPILCKSMVELLDTSNNSVSNNSSLSDYAFLYGVFPTAPSVVIYAAYYNAELEVITSGLVISTFLSAPIMYISAWLLTIYGMDPELSKNSLQNVSFDISIVSLFALIWTIGVMILSKKFKRPTHMCTVNLFVAQLLTCIGMILWNFVVKTENFILRVLAFTLLCASLYSTYIWPGLIAFSLLIKHYDSQKGSSLMVVAGLGIPSLVTAILLIFGKSVRGTVDVSFFYGRTELICSTVVISLSLLLGGGSLICLSRGSWAQSNENQEGNSVTNSAAPLVTEAAPEMQISAEPICTAGERERLICACAPPQPMPDMIISTNMDDTHNTLTGQFGNGCESIDCLLTKDELQKVADVQVVRHVLLCLLLAVCLLANLFSGFWLLYKQSPGTLYLELQFFCAVANFGQGLISFALFGLDKHFILLPFKRMFTRWYRKRQVQLEPDLPDDVRMTCIQFNKYHKRQCTHDIVKKTRCGKDCVVDCFLGSDLVEWLQRVGLAQDRGEAVLYGMRLQQGDVLQHIKQEYSFGDNELYYFFIK